MDEGVLEGGVSCTAAPNLEGVHLSGGRRHFSPFKTPETDDY
jgi:hypothetical protein